MTFSDTLKNNIKQVLHFLKWDVTKNIQYDRLTNEIINTVVNQNSVCIDVGAHKGEILDVIIKNAPNQVHYGFEPIPSLFNNLQLKYGEKCHILPYALSEEEGKSTFQFVKNAPAYSGIKQRKYAVKNPEIEEIEVELKRLDDVVPSDIKIDLIKIDVEGAEFMVLKGAKELLLRNKPTIIFECGLGASEFYNTNAEELFDYINSTIDLKLSTLKNFIQNKPSLTKEEFLNHYKQGSEYYFIAFK
jgi:FkbM family methyltransferase